MKMIIHAGGESSRMKDVYDGHKSLLEVGIPKKSLMWIHLQPFLKSKLIEEFIFTLRFQSENVLEHIKKLQEEFGFNYKTIIEPSPIGRAGSIKFGIEKGILEKDEEYFVSNVDDLVSVNFAEFLNFKKMVENNGKLIIMVMARKIANPFGVGRLENNDGISELVEFNEKPFSDLAENFAARTGLDFYLKGAIDKFTNIPLDRVTNPEQEIFPELTRERKIGVFLVDRWL